MVRSKIKQGTKEVKTGVKELKTHVKKHGIRKTVKRLKNNFFPD